MSNHFVLLKLKCFKTSTTDFVTEKCPCFGISELLDTMHTFFSSDKCQIAQHLIWIRAVCSISSELLAVSELFSATQLFAACDLVVFCTVRPSRYNLQRRRTFKFNAI